MFKNDLYIQYDMLPSLTSVSVCVSREPGHYQQYISMHSNSMFDNAAIGDTQYPVGYVTRLS